MANESDTVVTSENTPQAVSLVSSTGEEFFIPVSKLEDKSDYFKGLLRSGMKECLEMRVELPGLADHSLKIISDYMLHDDQFSFVSPKVDVLEDVLAAATYLQINKLVEICIVSLKSCLTVDEVVHISAVAEQYDLQELVISCYDFLHDNFVQFSGSGDFIKLTQEKAVELLSHSEILVPSEKSVFTAVVRWLKNNVNSEENSTHEISSQITALMETVRWPLMTDSDLGDCQLALMKEGWVHICQQFLDEHEAHRKDIYLIHTMSLTRVRPRRPRTCIAALGGFTKRERSTNRLQAVLVEDICCTVETSKLPFHTSKLPITVCEHCVCVVDGLLYVAGGQSRYTQDGSYTTNLVYRLDPRFNKWTKVCPMSVPRSLFYMGELGGCLYAICGWKAPNTVTRTVEKYIPGQNVWVGVASLDIGLHEHAGVVHKGCLYVSGGYKGPFRGHLNQARCYHPTEDSWSVLTPMLQARSYHSMAAMDNRLLVMGGVCYMDDDTFTDIRTCEVYDVTADQWSVVSATPLPASCMPCVQFKNKVFLFGGHSFETDSDHSNALILDTATWTWNVVPMANNGVLYFSAVVVQVPEQYLKKFGIRL